MRTFFFIATCVFLCASCVNRNDQEASGISDTIRLTDFRGKELFFERPPTRIVCLIESSLSGIYMLGAENLLAGIPTSVYRESVSAYYALLDERIRNRELPAPGNWDVVSIESLISLRPDLVIIWEQQSEVIGNIENLGIPVYAVMLKSFSDVHKSIRDIGLITGTSERAEELIRYTMEEVKGLSSAIKTDIRCRAYFAWAQGMLETSGSNSTVNELFELAGVENVITSPEEHLIISQEMLISGNPDLIVMWYNERLNPQDVLKMPFLRNVQAVKEGRVFELPSVFLCDFWTLKYPLAVKMLAKEAYPASFSDMDIQAEQNNMLTFLYGNRAKNLIQQP